MNKISALYCVRNEEDLIRKSIELILPFVDEVIFVDNGSTDNTKEQVEAIKSPKIKTYSYEYKEPVDMGAVRTFSLEKATSDWVWQIDADEWYPKDSCEIIKKAVTDAKHEISFRVPYYNLAWRPGYIQKIEHYPDRIYKREVVQDYSGVLPNDMTRVKPEYYQNRPFLEYDNPQDKSFENPVQPIINAPFYHLARTRGYNYELRKWMKYNKNLHPNAPAEEIKKNTRINQWVSGLYPMKKHEQTFAPKINIPNPKVSVIITNFQYENFVGDAIESALANKPWEVIVVDDCSQDNSKEVINRYPVKKIFFDENKGVSTARNAGIAMSTGDYFINLDADDKISHDYIEKTLAQIGENQVCFTDLEFFGDQSGVNVYPEFSIQELKQSQIIPSVCALVDRRVFEGVGGFDQSDWWEDWGFWLRVAREGFGFTQIHEPLFKYRRHGVSRVDLLDSKMKDNLKILKDRYGVVKGYDEKREKEAIKKLKK